MCLKMPNTLRVLGKTAAGAAVSPFGLLPAENLHGQAHAVALARATVVDGRGDDAPRLVEPPLHDDLGEPGRAQGEAGDDFGLGGLVHGTSLSRKPRTRKPIRA